MQIIHHGAKTGVTGSCHEFRLGQYGVLIDCGLFQGDETKQSLDIEFPISHIQALLLTHCHIDHIGRIPWLLAAGFRGPIYTTEATAALLPLMLDDGLKIQLNLNRQQRASFINLVNSQLRPVPFDAHAPITFPDGCQIEARFQPAGHILGSAYIEFTLPDNSNVVFSGDLGPCNTSLLVDPVSPVQADTLVIESTYGQRNHESVADRGRRLKGIITQSLQGGGVILIPAFSVGRTQELLFDLETIISQVSPLMPSDGEDDIDWQRLPVILDSPLAAEITDQYELFQRLWSKEAKERVIGGRHPLSFKQCITIESHQEHLALVNRLKASGEPAIVVAASGMCTGGRIMNYLEALLPDKRADLIMIGYQARGTLGNQLAQERGKVQINQRQVSVKASVHTMSGYSAHADQSDLLKFVANIKQGPSKIHIVHGEYAAQKALAKALQAIRPESEIVLAAEQ